MKYFRIILLLVCIFVVHITYAGNDSLLTQLTQTIQKTTEYDAAKIAHIEKLKQDITAAHSQAPEVLMPLYERVYEEYKSFKYDSAYEYTMKMIDIAYRSKKEQYLNDAKLRMSFVLLSSGLFKETYDSLHSINIKGSDSSFKAQYYILWGRYYYDIAAYDYDNYHSANYDLIGNRYMDSAISFLSPSTFDHIYYTGLRSYKQGKKDEAFTSLEKVISDTTLTYHQIALAASTLSSLYPEDGNVDKKRNLLVKASIADIRSSTKEAVALFHLAELLYKEGDLKNASFFIDNSLANAEFYDAKQRKIEAGTILPLIEAAQINAMETKKNQLIKYSIIVTVLMLSLILLSYIVMKQVSRLKLAQLALAEANNKQQEINQKLKSANKSLADVNEKLAEANKIKEKYIGFFFNADSDFYGKIGIIKQNIEKKLQDKKYSDIEFYLNKIDARKEKEELIHNFDILFLNLFPNFLNEMNALLREDEKIKLKEGELLNTDMRIFALMRMGISDPEKIASILDYSVKTIYTYKSKMKNRSDIPNDEFEHRIMAIKTL